MVAGMREMKDSGIEWIGKIPHNWGITKFKYETSDYKAGPFGSSLITEKLEDDGDILVYTPENVALMSDKTQKDQYLPENRRREMAQFFVKEGDIIFPIVGTLGRAMQIIKGMKEGIINQRLAKFRINSDKVDVNYFLWLFSRSNFYETYIDLYRRGAIIVNLTKTIVNEMPITVPPVNEQRKIASFLDYKNKEIDALSADVQAEIETLEAYKQSVIAEAVTKGLDKNVAVKDSGTPWCPKVPAHWEKVNPKALFSQRLDRAKLGERQLTASQEYGIVYQDEFMEMTGSRVVTVIKDFSILKHVEPGDFVISMRSFQGGLEYSEKRGCISSAYVMLIPNIKLVYPPFYRWFFKSCKYINAIQSTSNLVRDGQAMRYANFVQVPLFNIPLKEQHEIADYLDEKVADIEDVIKVKQEQLTVLADYKKSLIYEYVTGKKEVPING